jgi:GNAT superfamily N-acetyltransferase
METVDIAERRQQMGRATAGWAAIPGAVHWVRNTSWLYLSGLPSADANLALVHGDVLQDLADATDAIKTKDVPALLMLAADGIALAETLGPEWSNVGTAPFMVAHVESTPQASDNRVRRASAADTDVVAQLWAEGFGLPFDVCAPMVQAIASPSGDDMTAWVLENDGAGVSSVTTCRVDDAMTIWSMVTPQQYGRQGFGRALLADAMARASSDGIQMGLLLATPAGKPLYDATGWTTLEEWQIYANSTSAQFH